MKGHIKSQHMRGQICTQRVGGRTSHRLTQHIGRYRRELTRNGDADKCQCQTCQRPRRGSGPLQAFDKLAHQQPVQHFQRDASQDHRCQQRHACARSWAIGSSNRQWELTSEKIVHRKRDALAMIENRANTWHPTIAAASSIAADYWLSLQSHLVSVPQSYRWYRSHASPWR